MNTSIADPTSEWTGRPASGIRFHAVDFFLVPFSTLWFGMVVFITASAASNLKSAGPGLAVFAIFWVAGFYIFAGRFLVDMYLRSKTRYELRGDSALIVRDGLFANRTEVYLPSVASLNLSIKDDGSGTIYFGPKSWWNVSGMWSNYGPNTPTFEGIPDAQSIFDRCKAMRRR
jgi:hypothetical protein